MVAQADLEFTRQQLALRVLQAWSDAVAAHGKFVSYEAGVSRHQRLLDVVERRGAEGFSARADIDLARGRLFGVKADLLNAQAQRDAALDKLRLLTGRSIVVSQLEDVLNTPLPELGVSVDEDLTAARAQSPQIARARAQGKVAEAEAVLSRAQLSPEIFLRVEHQYGNFYEPGRDRQSRIFVGLSSNFGAGLSSLSGLDAARARQRAAEEEVQVQMLALDEQVQSDATLLRMSKERRLALERMHKDQASVTDSWERQFLAGRKQWQDLMNAAREQMQSEMQLADAMAAQQLTAWRLFILTQGINAVLARATMPLESESLRSEGIQRSGS